MSLATTLTGDLENPPLRTIYVPLPRDHDHLSLRETLLDAIPTIKTIHFAPGNLFAVFATPEAAQEGIQTINDSLRIRAQNARTELARDSPTDQRSSNGRFSQLAEPSRELVISAPKFLEQDDVENLLEAYEGFEDLNGRKATFSDALLAWKALDDLNSTTNLNANFLNARDAADDRGNGQEPPRRNGSTRGGPRTILITGIPKGADISVAKDLLGMMTRFKGFVRISFQVGRRCYVDFYDTASAQAAINRITANTTMAAVLARDRPSDPSQFLLEPQVASLFVRLESFLQQDDATALFNHLPGCEELVFAPQHCIVHFANRQLASRALEYLRRSTNLVVNYSKNGRRDSGNGAKRADVDDDPNGLPGVKVHTPPYGANAKELFSIYSGFRGMISDEDGALVGVYDTPQAAERAHAELLRSLSSETSLVRRAFISRVPNANISPSAVLYVSFNTSLTEGQVKRILSSYVGFVSFKSVMKSSGERYALAQFKSVEDATAALRDLTATTNLELEYSKRGDGTFGCGGVVADAGDGRPRRKSQLNGSAHGSAESIHSVDGPVPRIMTAEEDERSFQAFAGNQRNTVPTSSDAPAAAGRNSQKAILHITNPPPSASALKTFLTSTLDAERLVLKRAYCFVVFPDPATAAFAIPKLTERFPAARVDYARSSEMLLPAPPPVGSASKTISLNVGWNGAEALLSDLCLGFDGFKELESSPAGTLAHFSTAALARVALEDLNKTTNVQCSFSNETGDTNRTATRAAVTSGPDRRENGRRGGARRGSASASASGRADGEVVANVNGGGGGRRRRGSRSTAVATGVDASTDGAPHRGEAPAPAAAPEGEGNGNNAAGAGRTRRRGGHRVPPAAARVPPVEQPHTGRRDAAGRQHQPRARGGDGGRSSAK
ncbi:hypothetical protein HKX48_004588 [Thoreauomyces humboldtii]|nr:hypothetical protein HKX48_004588 [Thoreauomyces humboldtii]